MCAQNRESVAQVECKCPSVCTVHDDTIGKNGLNFTHVYIASQCCTLETLRFLADGQALALCVVSVGVDAERRSSQLEPVWLAYNEVD